MEVAVGQARDRERLRRNPKSEHEHQWEATTAKARRRMCDTSSSSEQVATRDASVTTRLLGTILTRRWQSLLGYARRADEMRQMLFPLSSFPTVRLAWPKRSARIRMAGRRRRDGGNVNQPCWPVAGARCASSSNQTRRDRAWEPCAVRTKTDLHETSGRYR